ncbi:MAG: hypothetical protein JXR91_10775 [Deltaproteobacteria bacterium]|nr:hypothetical protein [Deltaproteobacteria bacterium]
MHPVHSRKVFSNFIVSIFILVIQTGCERKTELALEKPPTVDSSTQPDNDSSFENNTDNSLLNSTDSTIYNDDSDTSTELADTSSYNIKTSNLGTDKTDEQ